MKRCSWRSVWTVILHGFPCMFYRVTRVVALAAMLTHIWVSMIVAPWHHLVAHRLSATQVESKTDTLLVVSSTHCHCRHHSHQTKVRPCQGVKSKSDHPAAPATPDHHDDCPVCQVLAQQFDAIETVAPLTATESVVFPPPASAIQPLLGCLFEPVSRGPPAV